MKRTLIVIFGAVSCSLAAHQTARAATASIAPATAQPAMQSQAINQNSIGAGSSQGLGNSISPGPNVSPTGGGNITAGPLSGSSFGAGPSIGTGPSVAPGMNFSATNQGVPFGNGAGSSNGTTNFPLRGAVTNLQDLETIGRLTANPNLTLARNAAGLFFVISPTGAITQVPIGTDVNGLVGNSTSTALSPMERAGLFNPFASPMVATPMTLVHLGNDGNIPAAVGTRSVYTNGFPTYVSGQIVSEYKHGYQHKTEAFARVIPKHTKRASPKQHIRNKFGRR